MNNPGTKTAILDHLKSTKGRVCFVDGLLLPREEINEEDATAALLEMVAEGTIYLVDCDLTQNAYQYRRAVPAEPAPVKDLFGEVVKSLPPVGIPD